MVVNTHGEDLLCSLVFRAKYCVGGSLNLVARGQMDLFVWSSLFFDKIVVEEGSIWRVEDGSKIDI